MSRMMSRGIVLTISRVSNYAILLLSPLILVRLLEVSAYGQYQEFMIYATLLIAFSSFGVDASLAYFLPRTVGREQAFVSQATLITLALTTVLVLVLLVARPVAMRFTSYDFVLPLAAYVFLFANLNWLEYYWIAKRQVKQVLYYSSARLLLRMAALLIAAFLTRDVITILWSMAAAELIRIVLVATFLSRQGLFTRQLRAAEMGEQLRFSLPIWLADIVQLAGRSVGKVFIGATMGPMALAYYAVGSYVLPLVHLLRGSVTDVVFPELVSAKDDRIPALRLWQRSNVMYCALMFPGLVLLFDYSELIIRVLFTDDYLPAVPVLQVYALFLLRRCFNLDALLRMAGRTGLVLLGTLLALVVNLALLVPLFNEFGLIGPAIAFLVADLLMELYNASRVMKTMNLRAGALIDWGGVGRVTAACMAGLPVLWLADHGPGGELLRAALGASAFLSLVWYLAYRLGVDDIGRFAKFLGSVIVRIGSRKRQM